MYDCPAQPQLPGFREIEAQDVDAVAVLLRRYMSRFDLLPVMSNEEVRHNFISGKGTGPVVNGRRNQQVTWTYVVEVSNLSVSVFFDDRIIEPIQ